MSSWKDNILSPVRPENRFVHKITLYHTKVGVFGTPVSADFNEYESGVPRRVQRACSIDIIILKYCNLSFKVLTPRLLSTCRVLRTRRQ